MLDKSGGHTKLQAGDCLAIDIKTGVLEISRHGITGSVTWDDGKTGKAVCGLTSRYAFADLVCVLAEVSNLRCDPPQNAPGDKLIIQFSFPK